MPLEALVSETLIFRGINDLKKKIQLSEGQRKAKFELCGIEKKRNADRIHKLKQELKGICTILVKPIKSDEIINQRAKGYLQPLGNKRPDEALSVLEYRLIDLNKKTDLLIYQHHKLQCKVDELEECRDRLLIEAKKFMRARQKSAEKSAEHQKASILENKIHHTELNAMEAETVRHKYSHIKSSLMEDSVKYEATLLKLEADIKSQGEEITKLQSICAEALNVRDTTKAMTVRQEEQSIRLSKERERKLQEQRMVVEEKNMELENLEHQLFPTSGVIPQLHRDSVTSLDNLGLAPNEENHEGQYSTSALEDSFKKLMVATGEVEPELVTHRFVGQKKTRNRLTYLRGLTEEDKRKMETSKADLIALLELSKFTAEVKSKEINVEEADGLIAKIEEEQTKFKELLRKLDEKKASEEMIMKSLQETYNSLKEFHLNEEKADTEGKDISCIALHFVEGAMLAAHKLAQQKNEEQKIRERASHSRLGSRAGYLNQSSSERTSIPQMAHKSREAESEEEEIPSRNYLKRQAQMIVDAKSRRRFFRPGKRMPMQTKKI